MMVSWVVYCLLVTTLVSVAAWLGERALSAQGWPVRWVWAGGLATTVGLPLWAWLGRTSAPAEAGAPRPGAYVMEALPPLTLAPSASPGPAPETLMVGAWVAVSGLLLLWLGVSALRLALARRGWRQEELHGVPVLVSDATGPAAMGVVRGRVVVPGWALELDERRRRLMVLHEAEHVRAGDPRLAVAALVACVLLPWNLPLWWQLRRLRLAIEMDCDARVLRRAGDVRGYGSLLLEVCNRRPGLALALAESSSSLERRIRMITNEKGRHTVRALGLAAVGALVLAVACETPGPVEVTDPEGRTVELEDVQSAQQAGRCEDPIMYVNGARSTAVDVDELEPERIDRIDVFKGAAATEAAGETVGGEPADCGVIVVLTKDATAEERAAVERLRERLQSAVRSSRPSTEQLAEQPVFTPMTVRPQLTNAGEVRRQLQEHYPPLLRDAGIGGTANVWFFIDAEGEVRNVRINQTSGRDALDEAALRVARTMVFSPAYNRDEAVPVWVALDITFDAGSDAAPQREAADQRMDRERRERVERERVDRDPQEATPPSPPASSGADLAREPTFTPMTERPQLRNQDEVGELLRTHYPPLLRDAGISGGPNVWLFIDAEGRVRDARINRSSGYEALDEAALRIAERMEFTPALNRGEAVPVWVALDITFEVQ